jgi:hypothetical protein
VGERSPRVLLDRHEAILWIPQPRIVG